MRSLATLCRALSGLLLITTLSAPLPVLGQTKTKSASLGKDTVIPAATGKVALYATDHLASVADVQSKLAGTGLFSQVDAFALSSGCSGTAATPTLQQLQQYDSIMVWSNCSFQDATALGNVLADYIDAGGGLVLAMFSFSSGNDFAPSGRLMSGGYYPFTTAVATQEPRRTLVKDIPSHPILQGVNSFDGGTLSYRSVVSLTQGAQQVARWTGNIPLAATRQITTGRVVGLNMYPVSNSINSGFWVSTTDGARLMSNSLLFAGRQLAPGVSPTAGQIIISEFRTSGPAGSRDEFIELFNATDSDLVINVNNTGVNAGLAINSSAQGGGCVGFGFTAVPNGTFIPARGHYLITNSQYSLGALARSDINPFSAADTDMADNTSLSLEKYESNPVIKLDRVGFGTNTCGGLFSEGTTLTPIDTAVGS